MGRAWMLESRASKWATQRRLAASIANLNGELQAVIKHYKRLPLCLALAPMILGLFASTAQAASRNELHAQNLDQLNSSYRAATRNIGVSRVSTERHAELLGLESDSSLSALAVRNDADGTTHYRYQQLYRGVPIWGEHVVVSENVDGRVRSLFGRSVSGLTPDVVQVGRDLGAASALQVAKNASLGSSERLMQVEREESRQMIFVSDDGRARLSTS